MEMVRRIDCTTQIVAQYINTSFAWGRHDCVRMAVAHIRRMGHRASLLKGGTYTSEFGAIKALKRAGFDTLEAALDARFDRIAPAAALPGDLIGLASSGDWPALTVAVGNGRVLGFMEGVCGIMQPNAYKLAWRVPVKGGK